MAKFETSTSYNMSHGGMFQCKFSRAEFGVCALRHFPSTFNIEAARSSSAAHVLANLSSLSQACINGVLILWFMPP
jgi:hypothetical protein